MSPAWIRTNQEGVLLAIKVQPRASKSEVVGILGNELKIRIAAPPVDSAANHALMEFIAEKTGYHQQQISVVRGAKSRSKTVFIRCATPNTIEDRLIK